MILPDGGEPPRRQQLATVTLSTVNGPRTVPAQLFDGLAVHKSLDYGWNVTHVLSGMQVANFRKRPVAIVAARRLAVITDWTLDMTKGLVRDDIVERAKAVIEEVKQAA